MKMPYVHRVVLSLITLLCAATVSAQGLWVEGSIVGVPRDGSPTVVYVWGDGLASAGQMPFRALPADVWSTVDLAGYELPTDVKAIELQGLLISSGQYNVYCGLVAAFRPPNSVQTEGNYQLQAVASVPGGAFRQNVTITVPVVDLKFQFWWHHPPDGGSCPMAIHLTLQKYVR